MSARPPRSRRLATLVAIAATLVLPGIASADGVAADADAVTAGPQSIVDLGDVRPSAEIALSVDLWLTCGNGSHVDPGQSVQLVGAGGIQPVGGEIVSIGDGSVGPAPVDWPVDGVTCPSPAPTLTGGASSLVVLRAPALPGDDYEYLLTWSQSLSPAGTLDGTALRGGTSLTLVLDVVANTPPVLSLPGDLVVEGDTLGGWTAAFAASAVDAEDDPDPVPDCSLAPGDVLPLGLTTVTCSVTDAGGLGDSGTFDVTVVDTIAPNLASPGDRQVTTVDPAGTTLVYDLPLVIDTVDEQPDLACAPAPGTSIPVGTTTVTCTATDGSGNSSAVAFDVQVVYAPVHVATAAWLEPVGASGTLLANRGRSVPVKVTLAVDGSVATTGHALLTVVPCDGGTARTQALAYGGGRWNAAVDTATLPGWCHTVTASIDGLDAGSFRLDLRGGEPSKARVRGR